MSLKINENVDLKDGNSVATGAHFCYSGIYAYKRNKGEVEVAIDTVDETSEKITINAVDLTDKIKTGSVVTIRNSTGNDAIYSVSTCVLVSNNTEIVVNEDIVDGTDDGDLVYIDSGHVLEVAIVGFASEVFHNKHNGSSEYGLKLDSSNSKPIDSSYSWDITISEYEIDNYNNLADTKFKASLETAGYTPANVVID